MRPGNLPSSAGFRPWHSPVPYLFGGVAAMMVLIAIALIVLACTQRKTPEEDRPPSDQKETPTIGQLEMEATVVVIMAGDDNPTYYARPLSPILAARDR
ncbi:hypothetical protein HPP92_004988 [Vanilla planifolia]|uniref:Uncharacterized protein n=1 Tax=Vanilla planifolia TaxID=51239 RepID=A0A835RRC9_VANPL|nr:hypothetical protein HPP92_004988 [Vanilla planifolia]